MKPQSDAGKAKIGAINANYGVDMVRVPHRVAHMLRAFLVDKRTGNVQLNIREGRILGLTIEEKVTIKTG